MGGVTTDTTIETCVKNLINAAEAFHDQHQLGHSLTAVNIAPARHHLLTLLEEVRGLLMEPHDLLRSLANQIQILACLQWLGDFQILACIPLCDNDTSQLDGCGGGGGVQIQDISDIACVPVGQLTRVLAMMTSIGFLREPEPRCVAHTALSARFVTKPSYLDAALFLAETVAPSALNMAKATKEYGGSIRSGHCAYSLTFNATQPLQSILDTSSKFQRQFLAYSRYLGDTVDDSAAVELLGRLNWTMLGNARIVDATAESLTPAIALAKLYPSLNFVVQTSSSTSLLGSKHGFKLDQQIRERITVRHRAIGELQPLKDAAVYVVRLASSGMATSFAQLRSQILAELQAHMAVLIENAAATLVLLVQVLSRNQPMASMLSSQAAHTLDLSLLQLENDRSIEINDICNLIDTGQNPNGHGKLVVVNQVSSEKGPFVLFGIKYQVTPNVF